MPDVEEAPGNNPHSPMSASGDIAGLAEEREDVRFWLRVLKKSGRI